MDNIKPHVPDRLYVSKNKIDKIRGIKEQPYFQIDKHKETFLLAMALGADLYTSGATLELPKKDLFLDKDLFGSDKAMIYALVAPALDNIEDITDKGKVYQIAEVMADKGFDILLDKMESRSPDMFILQAIKEANQLYEEAEQNNLFFD